MDERITRYLEDPQKKANPGTNPLFPVISRALIVAICGLWAFMPGWAQPRGAKEKPTTYVIQLPPAPDFSQLDWLIGDWSGKTTSRDPQGDIHFSAAYDLGKRVMILRETVALPAKDTVPAVNETWMGILTDARPGADFILRVFSSTGFVTRYRVSVDGTEIHFSPDGGDQPPPGWLFRRVLTRIDADQLTETLQAAPPQKAFFDYYAAKLVRNKASAGK